MSHTFVDSPPTKRARRRRWSDNDCVMRLTLGFSFVAVAGLVACGRTVVVYDEGAGISGAGGVAQTASVGSGNAGAGASGDVGVGPISVSGPGPGPSTVTTVATSVTATTVSTSTGMMTCPSLGDPCTGCIAKSCAGYWCNCSNSKECLALLTCFGKCKGDESCHQNCMSQYPNGIADALLVSGCGGTTCKASCGSGSGDFGGCQECVFTSCPSETNACLSDPECISLWKCLNACPQFKISCHQACFDDYGNSVSELEAWIECSAKKCGKKCAGKL